MNLLTKTRMKLLFDIFPVFLFFVFYKLYDIYFATSVAMAASVLQVLLYRIKHHRYEKIHLISLALILVLGGATLFFRNPWFIKWKPTGIYWLTSLVFLGSFFIGQKPLVQKMMEKNIQLPSMIWQRLNGAWSLFFFFMGSINLYIAYHYSTDTWVTFKLFGGIGSTLLFVLIQAIYLTKHTSAKAMKHPSIQK